MFFSALPTVFPHIPRLIDPYVPMKNGPLSQNLEITKDYVRYKQIYAHYMYMGIKYGPNIPQFDEFGHITGFVSPKGKKKHSTGKPLNYSKEKHPLQHYFCYSQRKQTLFAYSS